MVSKVINFFRSNRPAAAQPSTPPGSVTATAPAGADAPSPETAAATNNVTTSAFKIPAAAAPLPPEPAPEAGSLANTRRSESPEAFHIVQLRMQNAEKDRQLQQSRAKIAALEKELVDRLVQMSMLRAGPARRTPPSAEEEETMAVGDGPGVAAAASASQHGGHTSPGVVPKRQQTQAPPEAAGLPGSAETSARREQGDSNESRKETDSRGTETPSEGDNHGNADTIREDSLLGSITLLHQQACRERDELKLQLNRTMAEKQGLKGQLSSARSEKEAMVLRMEYAKHKIVAVMQENRELQRRLDELGNAGTGTRRGGCEQMGLRDGEPVGVGGSR